MPFRYNALTGKFDLVDEGPAGASDVFHVDPLTAGKIVIGAGTDFITVSGIDVDGSDNVSNINTISVNDIPTTQQNLDLEPGVDIQVWSAILDQLALLSPSEGDMIVGDGTPEWSILSAGGEGEVLTIVGGVPDWATPSGGSITLTPDTGTALTSTSFDIFGHVSGSAQVMETLSVAGDFLIENRVFDTPYVVDPSSTAGTRGTFTTIQGAINAAVVDGVASNNLKKILIRSNTNPYIENLTIPAGIVFESYGFRDEFTSGIQPVTIQGAHTLANVCNVSSIGVNWTNSTADIFTGGTTFLLLNFFDCNVTVSGNHQIVSSTASQNSVYARNSLFVAGVGGVGFDISSGTVLFDDCTFDGCYFEMDGSATFENCKGVGNVVGKTSVNVYAINTHFSGIIDADVITNGGSATQLWNCIFSGNFPARYCFSGSSTVSMVNCSMPSGLSTPRDFTDSSIQVITGQTLTGNVLKAERSATNIVAGGNENYIGITDTSSPRTVQIRMGDGGANTLIDYQVFVVDESGNAGTNNITVTGVDSENINGASSYVIDQDYGFALFHTDGTEWYVISDSKPAGGGSTPLKSYYFKASDFDALETNFAPLNQDNGSTARILSRAFDDTTEEFVNFSLKVPSDIDTSGTVTCRVWMYAETAVASRFVQLTFDHRAVDNSETWDGAYTSEDSGDLAIDGTQDDITEATWTETVSNLGWAANDFVMCRLSRIAPSGTNLSGDLYVVGFSVEVPRAS